MAASNLAVRVATAVVGGAVVVALLLWAPPPAFFAFVLGASLVAAWELASMFAPRDTPQRLVTVGATGLVALALYFAPEDALAVPAVLALTTIVLGALYLAQPSSIESAGTRLAVSLAAVVYVGCLLPFVALLHRPPLGSSWVVLSLVIAWCGDTAAYFAGRAFGRHKLAPQVSPKKTIEGAVGGLAASAGASAGVGYLLLPGALPIVDALVVGVLGGLVGQLGDLVESLLKRSAGVKDSGRILPGHGGVLDRVDALMFAAPAVYLYLRWRGVI